MLRVLILLASIINHIQTQSLFYQAFNDNSFVTDDSWTITGAFPGIYSDCGTTRILGGYNRFGSTAKIMKYFLLPPHYSMIISFQFWKVDSWDYEHIYFQVDQYLAYTQQFDSNTYSSSLFLCGGPIPEEIMNIRVQFDHNFRSTFMLMTSDLNSNPDDESWGIHNFQIYLFLCPIGCLTCDSSEPQLCLLFILMNSAFLTQSFDSSNLYGWTVTGASSGVLTTNCAIVSLLGGSNVLGTGASLTKTIALPPHNMVRIQFRFAVIDTWDNEFVYLQLDNKLFWTHQYSISQQKTSICGGSYDDIFYNQQIQFHHQTNTLSLKIDTNLNTASWDESFGLREFQVFTNLFACGDGVVSETEECDDGNIYAFDGCFGCRFSCVEGCSLCLEGECLDCKTGWQFLPEKTCKPILSDQLLVESEICDDSLNNGICYEGNFICHQDCIQCEFGRCSQCKSGFMLINNKCDILCNDLLTNIDCNIFYWCKQCQDTMLEGCQVIKNGVCIMCRIGWKLQQYDNKCLPLCGDNIIVGAEQCDFQSVTSLNYGCNSCVFECQEQCVRCLFGKCLECEKGWKIDNFKCTQNEIQITLECPTGWFLDIQLQKCLPKCGDGIIVGDEECDDGENYHICQGCKFICDQFCALCKFGVCQKCKRGFELDCNYNCQKYIIDQCQEGCQSDNGTKNCAKGWIIDDLSQKCIPKCGDGIIVGNEECDDGQNHQSCYGCKFICDQLCVQCQFGKCLKCKQGYELDSDNICQKYKKINSLLNSFQEGSQYDNVMMNCKKGWTLDDSSEKCIPICGDGLIVGNEECDNGGNDFICSNCKLVCDPRFQRGYYIDYYKSCSKNQQENNSLQVFDSCQNGMKFDYVFSVCIPICGDNILKGNEECDDGNEIPNDGCFQCKFQCIENCRQCEQGVCVLCEIGFQLNENKICDSVCGDGIVLPYLEQCDDNNNNKYDGCYDCKQECSKGCSDCQFGVCLKCYIGSLSPTVECITVPEPTNIQCPSYCNVCDEGKCSQCIEGFYLDYDVCVFIEEKENEQPSRQECDDENSRPNDGCYKYKIEKDWECDDSLPSICTFSYYPQMNVQLQDQVSGIQYIHIAFSQQIRIKTAIPLSQTMDVKIHNISSKKYNITINPISEATFDLSFPEYLISVQINKTTSFKPIATIDLNQDVFNKNNQTMHSNQTSVSLNISKYLDQNQLYTAETLASFGLNIMYSLTAISVVNLFMGEASVFQLILNLLQYYAYLKYINLDYPENLMIFFSASDFVSIQPLLSFINFNYYADFIMINQETSKAYGKFQFYQVETDLINNLSSQMIQVIGFVLTFILFKVIKTIFYNYRYISKYFCFINRQFSRKAALFFTKLLNEAIKIIQRTISIASIKGIKTILLLNCQDLLFKSLLYINTIEFFTIREIAMIIISFSIQLIYISLILSNLNLQTNFEKQSKSQIITEKCAFASLCKFILFFLFLTCIQDNSIFQTICVALTSLFYFLFLFQLRYRNGAKNTVEMIVEGSVIGFTISSFIFFKDFSFFFSEELKIIMGWAHIGLFCLGLSAYVVQFIVHQIKNLQKFFHKKPTKSKIVHFYTIKI